MAARVADKRLLRAADTIHYAPCPGTVNDLGHALKGPHLDVRPDALAYRDDAMHLRPHSQQLTKRLMVILLERRSSLSAYVAGLHLIDADHKGHDSIGHSSPRALGRDQALARHPLEQPA